MAKGSCKVTIAREGKVIEALPGVSLRFLLMKHDYELPFPCGGEGICGKCRVLFTKNPPPPNIYDQRNLSEKELSKGMRLACKAVIEGDCEILLPERYKALSLISKGDMLIHLEELIEAPAAGSQHCIGIDLGTTTLFVSVVEIPSKKRLGWSKSPNPQAAWGSDLISRIKAASDPTVAREMVGVTMQAIEREVEALLAEHGVPREGLSYALAGNAPMEELFYSETLAPFARHPFSGRLKEPAVVNGPFGLPMDLLPVVGGMIGGDALSLLEVAEIKGLSLPMLGIDLGTNAEVFLVTKEGTWATSAPAGPAFEGMGLKHGIGWQKGAVISVEKENSGLKVETVEEETPRGFCGSGIISFLSLLVREWVVGRDGRIREPSRLSGLWEGQVREEDGSRVVYLPHTSLSISQDEIRQLQMAIAAISAAIKILANRSGCSLEEIATLAIAGGFGSSLSPQWLKDLGIPIPPYAQTVVLGNTALCGAELWNANRDTPERMRRTAGAIKLIQLAEEEEFERIYIDSMHFG